MPRDIERYHAVLIPRVDLVKYVAGFDLKPANIPRRAIAWHHSEACATLAFEAKRYASCEQFKIKRQGQIHKHHVIFGDAEVMHHDHLRQFNAL